MSIKKDKESFSGNIFIFHAYDVGDDINLEQVRDQQLLVRKPLVLAKYFKNYHIPLAVDLPHPNSSPHLSSAKLHNFGAISLLYKIPFNKNFDELKKEINQVENEYHEQSVIDAQAIFKRIKKEIKQAKFFHLKKSYVVIQVDQKPQIMDIVALKEEYGSEIVSLLRFETETLSEYQRNELLESAIGYYRGDLMVIDTEAAFVYDDEYDSLLDLFEFANIQQLELQYFDRILDQHLNKVYKREIKKLPLKYYLPFIDALSNDPISDLGNLKVDISVITERLENSIKLSGESYYSEVYSILNDKLDISRLKESINRKFDIIKDIRTVYEDKVNAIREDLLSVLVILLILIEVIIGILQYFK